MTVEAVFAGGNYGGLELQDQLVAQPRGVRQIARGTPDSGDKPFVRIHANRNLMRQGGHG